MNVVVHVHVTSYSMCLFSAICCYMMDHCFLFVYFVLNRWKVSYVIIAI